MNSIHDVVRLLRDAPDGGKNDYGDIVKRMHRDSERYVIDFDPTFKAEGWQQFDTDQDAHYFGVWLNPRLRVILSYAEGDWGLDVCPDWDHYTAAVQRCIDFYKPGRIARIIGSEGVIDYCQDRSEFLKGEDAKLNSIGDVLGGAS